MENINNDYKEKSLVLNNKELKIYYNEVLINGERAERNILKPLIKIKDYKDLDKKLPTLNTITIKEKDLNYYINNGFVIIKYDKYYAIECRNTYMLDKLEYEKSQFASNISFTENINNNLYLIRNRIKSNKLKSVSLDMGSLTNTRCIILYIDGITEEKLVKKIYKRLKSIKIDGIFDSCYLKDYLNKFSIFPTITSTLRPDKASSMLLEGKIVIISDNSNSAIVLPNIFIDFFHTMDDYYSSYILSSFIRIIRLISFFISVYLPSIYMLSIKENYTFLNKEFVKIIRKSCNGTIFNIFFQIIFLIIIFNILRESDLHKSENGSATFSLLGGLVLGSSAVFSKIVSPISLIVISLSTISNLVFDSYEFQNTLNILKLFVVVMSYIFNTNGFIISIILIFIVIVTTKSFNKNYFYPFIPFDKKSFIDSILRIKVHNKYRNKIFTKNIKRGRI